MYAQLLLESLYLIASYFPHSYPLIIFAKKSLKMVDRILTHFMLLFSSIPPKNPTLPVVF